MQDASEKCMNECKKNFAVFLHSLQKKTGESNAQVEKDKKDFLIAELIRSGCADENSRSRLSATPVAGLVGELCGCKCSGYFPYKGNSSDAEPGSLESIHPPPDGAKPP